MKILLLYTYNPSYLSSFFTEFAFLLVDKGHEVSCLSFKNREHKFQKKGVHFIISKKGSYYNNYKQVYNIIKVNQPDMVISNFSYVNPALFAGFLLRVRYNYAWIHSLNEQTGATKSQIFIKKQFLKLADLLIANSKITKEQIEAVYNFNSVKVVMVPFWTNITDTIYNNLETESIYSKKSFNVGCPGRMSKDKNQNVIIEAIAQMKTDCTTNLELYFAGSGQEKEYIECLVKERNLSAQTYFLGVLSAEDMVAFYQNMDIIILPSLHEAFGLVFIEAIALGIPVLVSNKFGALTYIDSKKYPIDQFSFDPNDIDELKLKIELFQNSGYSNSINFRQIYLDHFHKPLVFQNILNTLHIHK